MCVHIPFFRVVRNIEECEQLAKLGEAVNDMIDKSVILPLKVLDHTLLRLIEPIEKAAKLRQVQLVLLHKLIDHCRMKIQQLHALQSFQLLFIPHCKRTSIKLLRKGILHVFHDPVSIAALPWTASVIAGESLF